jgi:ketosteroid isomerase-like protein
MTDQVETNLALARRQYELWNAGGVQASAEEVWAPEIVFYEASELPDTDVFHGIDEVAARMRDIVEQLGLFQFEVLSLEGRGDYLMAALQVKAEGTTSGAAVTTPMFHVARYENGRASELWSFFDADAARREYERLSSSGD